MYWVNGIDDAQYLHPDFTARTHIKELTMLVWVGHDTTGPRPRMVDLQRLAADEEHIQLESVYLYEQRLGHSQARQILGSHVTSLVDAVGCRGDLPRIIHMHSTDDPTAAALGSDNRPTRLSLPKEITERDI